MTTLPKLEDMEPPAKGACPECGVQHPVDQPHDRNSVYYQAKFSEGHDGILPSWHDALAHCPDGVKSDWEQALRAINEWSEEGKDAGGSVVRGGTDGPTPNVGIGGQTEADNRDGATGSERLG